MKRRSLQASVFGLYGLTCLFCLLFSVFSDGVWAAASLITILLLAFLLYRRAQEIGLDACRIRKNLLDIERDAPEQLIAVDQRMLKYAYRPVNGLRGAFLPGIVFFAIDALNIVLWCAKLRSGAIFELFQRLAMCVTIPYRALFAPWADMRSALDIVSELALMFSPFVFSLLAYAGYLRGPKKWEKLEALLAAKRASKLSQPQIQVKKKLRKTEEPEI